MTSEAARPTREPDLFDPIDVQWTAVSPRLATARLTVAGFLLVPLLIGFVLLAVLVGAAWLWVLPAVIVLVGVLVVRLVPRQVRSLAYAERADDLLVVRGIVFRQLVVVPYGRMQYVDVTAGPLDRRFGIASVQLHTASPATTASIDGLPPQEAARLRDRLASRGEARLAGL